MVKPIIIKKSPIVIVKNFILLQGVAIVAFFVAGAIADYGEIYTSLFISRTISFRIAEALLIFSVETAIVFFIFFRWYRESFQIRRGEIVHAHGVLYRQRTIIPLDNVVSVSHRYSPLGKLTKYGTIELTGNNTDKKVKLENIPMPEECVDLILKFKKLPASKNPEVDEVIDSNLSVSDLLKNDEHENLEFKSTFRWDTRRNIVNKTLEKSVMKTIAAFLNSQGGHLVIGVDDNKTVVGVSFDCASLMRKDADGFENHFTQVFQNMIGPEFRQLVKLSWSQMEGKECCVISVSPSHKPAYLKNDNSGEEFYIRTGNGTTALKLSEAKSYIDSRWDRF